MANNTPITARISKGLFGKSSSKVTEPLLNVGPAGVSGNNQTKDIPSPSKMKSAFKMMSSPFKQLTDSAGAIITKGPIPATVSSTSTKPSVSIPGKTETKTTTTKKAYVGKADDACSAEYIKVHGTDDCTKWKALPQATKDRANTTIKTEEVETPGTTTPGETTTGYAGLQTFREGTAKTAQDRRDDRRDIIAGARQTKREQIKKGRIESKIGSYKNEKGETVNIVDKKKHIKDTKLKARLEQSETKEKGFKGTRDAAVLEAQQSAATGGTFKGVTLDPTTVETVYEGELSGPEKTASAKARAAANAGATTAGKFESTFKGGVDKVSSKFSTPEGKKETNKEDEAPLGTYKKDNGFFAKKSPMKLKYFK